ncbi:MAG: universal stress protein [Bryobacterales bacterium]|nr:universal stress protein [Bryobacterales bacterium]
MTEFKHILFPVDFSAACIETAPQALEMARLFNSRLTALHVLNIVRSGYIDLDASLVWLPEEIAEMKSAGQEHLNRFIREHLNYETIRSVVEDGEPASVITSFVEREKVELVMLPTRGTGRFRRYMLGSVTAKVLYDCPCPVWTSAHTEQAGVQETPASPLLLCATNLEPAGATLLRWASELAVKLSAALRVIHVVPAVEEESKNPGAVAVRDYLFEKAREKWNRVREEAGVDVDLCLAGGDIARRVAAEAARNKASTVAIARGRLNKPFGGLRTQAYSIVRESPCPVIAM